MRRLIGVSRVFDAPSLVTRWPTWSTRPDAIASASVGSSERLGRVRWVVERPVAWLVAHRRLATRYHRHATPVLAFLHLTCALLCLRCVEQAEAKAHRTQIDMDLRSRPSDAFS